MGRTPKKPVTQVTITLNVCLSRTSDEYQPKEFTGESYDAILDQVWNEPGLDHVDLDSQVELMRLAKIDREQATAREKEEQVQAEQVRLKAEEARKAARQKTGPKLKVPDYTED